MRVNVDGSCWNNGTLGQPGFRVTSLNTGGLNLSGIVTTFDLPNNATYAGLDPVTDNVPGGAVFEVSADGVDWTATAPGDAPDLTIRHVRLRNFGIVAGVSALPVRFKVRVAALDQGVLDGAAWMDSAELSPTPLTTSEFVPGTCPSDIVMRKFFDADGSGAQNDDEPTLAGWTFTLTNGTSYSQVTAASTGEVRFLDVPPGAWTFSETQPGNLGTQSTWSQTTGIDVVVVAGNGELLSIPVGNRCTCTADFDGNECTSPGCDPTGACTSPEQPSAEGQTCGTNACAISECQSGACVATSNVSCGDGNSCTTDSCDAVEGCVNALPTCGVVDFYATVSDGTRTGQVHCTVTAGAAPLCDTESDGRTLRIAWNAPSMCGAWSAPVGVK